MRPTRNYPAVRFAAVLIAAALFDTAFIHVGQCGEGPLEQEAKAVAKLRGVASNIQTNRDGTVRFVRFSKPNVTDEAVAEVAAFKRIDYLAVVTPKVTDAGFQHIRDLTNLDTLLLEHSSITSAGLANLQKLTKLQRLYLADTRIDDAGLRRLTGLAKLTTLTLSQTAIGDEGLKHLRGLTSLERLYLDDTRVTDAGLGHLQNLTALRTLYLSRTKVRGPGLGAAQEAGEPQPDRLPGLQRGVGDFAESDESEATLAHRHTAQQDSRGTVASQDGEDRNSF